MPDIFQNISVYVNTYRFGKIGVRHETQQILECRERLVLDFTYRRSIQLSEGMSMDAPITSLPI